MGKEATINLKDLEGLPGLTVAHYATSRTAALKLVRDGKTVTAAGRNGALNIWRDHSGCLRAAFYRQCVTLSRVEDLTINGLGVWLAQWFKQLEHTS